MSYKQIVILDRRVKWSKRWHQAVSEWDLRWSNLAILTDGQGVAAASHNADYTQSGQGVDAAHMVLVVKGAKP